MNVSPLIRLCQRVAAKGPLWVQGPGGNISVKAGPKGRHLWIKVSGCRLDEVKSARGLCRIDTERTRRELRRISGRGNPEARYASVLAASAWSPAPNKRPSMEAGMHVFLPGKWVLHFHSLGALLMARAYRKERKRFRAWMNRRWRGGFAFVEACSPGWKLSKRLERAGRVSLLILENHGLILQGPRPDILDQWRRVEERFLKDWGYARLSRLMRAARAGRELRSFEHPAPLRLYIPDSAVFLNRLKKILVKAGGSVKEPRFVLRSGAWSRDRDVSELWKATELLFDASPDLPELPVSILSRVADLPTEKFRRQVSSAVRTR